MKRRAFLAVLVAAPAVVTAANLMRLGRPQRWALQGGLFRPIARFHVALKGPDHETLRMPVVAKGYDEQGRALVEDVTWSGVTGQRLDAIVLYNPRTGRVVHTIDYATGLPLDPNGGDLILNFAPGLPL